MTLKWVHMPFRMRVLDIAASLTPWIESYCKHLRRLSEKFNALDWDIDAECT